MVEIKVQLAGRDIKVYTHEGGQQIGFAIGELTGKTVELETIHVDACRRGKGIGGSLLRAFMEQARTKGARSLTGEMKPEFGLNFDKTARFYRKHGITVDDEKLTMDF